MKSEAEAIREQLGSINEIKLPRNAHRVPHPGTSHFMHKAAQRLHEPSIAHRSGSRLCSATARLHNSPHYLIENKKRCICEPAQSCTTRNAIWLQAGEHRGGTAPAGTALQSNIVATRHRNSQLKQNQHLPATLFCKIPLLLNRFIHRDTIPEPRGTQECRTS